LVSTRTACAAIYTVLQPEMAGNWREELIGSTDLGHHRSSRSCPSCTVPPKKDIQEFPIAARISWIGGRHTTRVEDMSYSLLGILNINMPMLYGEGQKAFLRLQGEIIKKYHDLSIFAGNGEATESGFMPILADRPSSFAINPMNHQSRDTSSQLGDRLRTQFSLTNQGVFFPSAKLRYQTAVPGYRHHYLLSLNYQDPSFLGRTSAKQYYTNQRYILLQKIGPGLFVRLHDPPDRLKAFQKKRSLLVHSLSLYEF